MKKLFTICCFLLFIISTLYGEQRTLDLEECLHFALLNNESLLSLKKEYEIAQQRIIETNAFLYPHLDFGFNYFRYSVEKEEKLGGIPYEYAFLPGTSGETEDYFVTRFSLTQHLYSGGRVISTKKLAEMSLKKAEIQLERAKKEIVFQTKKAFYDYLRVREKMHLYGDALNFAEQIYSQVSKQNIPIEEERKISSYRNQLRSSFNNSEYEFKEAKLQVLNTLGIELNTEITLQGELESSAQEINLEKCLAWAYQYRPELKLIRVEEEIDLLAVNLALAERYPTMSLGINYFFVGKIFPSPEKNWSATLGVSLPLFDGWAGWSKIKQRQIQAEQSKLKKTEWEDLINLEIRQAYNGFIFWQKEREYRSKEEKEEEKFLEILKAKWSTKEIKAEQLLTAFENYLLAKERSLEAISQHLISQAKLEKAMGKSLVEK